MAFEYIDDLCKWTFLHHSNNISIAAVFIDMHGNLFSQLLLCMSGLTQCQG